MALYNPDASSATPSSSTSGAGTAPPPGSNDEVDLREYFLVMARWWREILLLTAVVTGSVFAYSLYQRANAPVRYQAAATVVVARVFSDVNLDTGVRTQVDAGSGTAQGGTPRRNTLVALVRNGQIAEAVLEELADLPGMERYTPARLMRSVTATSTTDTNQPGDLIEIRVIADTPELAAAITNAWAVRYVSHINAIYGEMPIDIVLAVEELTVQAQLEYEVVQRALEEYLATNPAGVLNREISDKQTYISTLRTSQNQVLEQVISEVVGSRVSTLATYLNAQNSNRLLAFRREQQENRQLLNDLISIEIENRQLALQTEQEVRRQLFQQYAQTELDNRLLALRAEQAEKTVIFDAASQVEANARIALYNEQFSDRVSTLAGQFEKRRELENLLEDARSLQSQVTQANDGNLQSSALAILLLKAQVFATSTQLPSSLTLNITDTDLDRFTSDQLIADTEILVSVLEARIVELNAAIAVQSGEILVNEDYLTLTGTRADDDGLYQMVQQIYVDLFDLGELTTLSTQTDMSQLSGAIAQRYDELFLTGPLIGASLALGNVTSEIGSEELEAVALEAVALEAEAEGESVQSAVQRVGQQLPLQQAIEEQYPHLFRMGNLTQILELIGSDTELDDVTNAQIQELMRLEGLDDIPGYSALTEPTQAVILQLDAEIRVLQSELERADAQRSQLERARNRAASALDTLSNKMVELELQRAASNREVSVGAFALVPDVPVSNGGFMMIVVAAAGISFVMAIFFAFVANMLGAGPPLARRRRYA